MKPCALCIPMKEFYERIKNLPYGDYVVNLWYQQNEHYKPDDITTIYYNYPDSDAGWLDDWDEGGEAYVLGFDVLHHIDVVGRGI